MNKTEKGFHGEKERASERESDKNDIWKLNWVQKGNIRYENLHEIQMYIRAEKWLQLTIC